MNSVITLDKLHSLAQDACASGELSVVFDRPYILVDAENSLPFGQSKTIDTRIFQQPMCPVIALKNTDTDIPAIVDIVAQSDKEIETLTSAIRKNPVAATMLVQLLRHNEHNSIYHGLCAESLSYSCLQNGSSFKQWLNNRKPRGKIAVEQSPIVLVRRDETQLHITLNRESKRNAYSADLRDALYQALLLAATDNTIENVTIKGAGHCFSAGGDLDEFGSATDSAFAHTVRMTRNTGLLLNRLKHKAHFILHGACIGAGIELPSFSSRVSARRDTFFQLPEVAMGLIPGAGGTVSITKRIGRIRTAFMAISNEKIDTEKALNWGLIDEII